MAPGVFFTKKWSNFTDGYRAHGNILLPSTSSYLTTQPSFVGYAFFGAHRTGFGNFDAGVQVRGGGFYKLFINGGGVITGGAAEQWRETSPFQAAGSSTLFVELQSHRPPFQMGVCLCPSRAEYQHRLKAGFTGISHRLASIRGVTYHYLQFYLFLLVL